MTLTKLPKTSARLAWLRMRGKGFRTLHALLDHPLMIVKKRLNEVLRPLVLVQPAWANSTASWKEKRSLAGSSARYGILYYYRGYISRAHNTSLSSTQRKHLPNRKRRTLLRYYHVWKAMPERYARNLPQATTASLTYARQSGRQVKVRVALLLLGNSAPVKSPDGESSGMADGVHPLSRHLVAFCFAIVAIHVLVQSSVN